MEKLGRRLRKGTASPDDLRLLAGYRRSFLAPYREVILRIGSVTSLVPSGRPAKSTASIVAKLQRQTGTLTQMQDIAGCRLVTEDIVEQDVLVGRLVSEFSGAAIVDRRLTPSAGYRAVHVLVGTGAVSVEIQVRTRLQDLWAQCSERLAFSVDPAIKYGGGPPAIAKMLVGLSELIASFEANQSELASLTARFNRIPSWVRRTLLRPWAKSIESRLLESLDEAAVMERRLSATLNFLARAAESFKGGAEVDDLFD